MELLTWNIFMTFVAAFNISVSIKSCSTSEMNVVSPNILNNQMANPAQT